MTSKLTREQLHERARENVKALKMASRQTAFESAREEILADLQLAELALAAMAGEPVGEFYEDGPLNWYQISDGDRVPAHRRVPLYRRAQPAPAFPDFDNVLESLDYEVRCNAWESEHVLQACQATYDACRAAMLAAAPQEVQVVPKKIEQSRKRVDRCDVCTEGARGGCGTCIFNGNFE
ncbi:TPA: hypothetical protein ACGR43_000152 [Klebsiella pneumoniae]